jgi:hypothetical protein
MLASPVKVLLGQPQIVKYGDRCDQGLAGRTQLAVRTTCVHAILIWDLARHQVNSQIRWSNSEQQTHFGRSQMSLEALPAETLERIVTCIDAREDLINLSSVSHALNPIISERHLEYRDIRCHLNMDVLWEHLIANSDLAGNIRKLDIQPDGYGLEDNVLWPFPVRVPKRFLPEEQPVVETSSPPSDEHLDRDRRSETLLIFALKNMRNLTNFKWNRNPPLFDSLAGVGNEDIWTTLRSYTALLDLDVVDYSEFSPVHCAQADPVGFSYLRPIWDSAVCMQCFL